MNAGLAQALSRPVVTDRGLVSACAVAGVPAFRLDDPNLDRILDGLEAVSR